MTFIKEKGYWIQGKSIRTLMTFCLSPNGSGNRKTIEFEKYNGEIIIINDWDIIKHMETILEEHPYKLSSIIKKDILRFFKLCPIEKKGISVKKLNIIIKKISNLNRKQIDELRQGKIPCNC